MNEDKFYKEAMDEINDLANDVMEQCIDFANNKDYDQEWVLDRFQEQFSGVKVKYLKNKN
ncbi:MAG: hypothetical protein MRZ75_02405 [Roseburia sp.]|nr:hypothetical protein [Roseburia sp.]